MIWYRNEAGERVELPLRNINRFVENDASSILVPFQEGIYYKPDDDYILMQNGDPSVKTLTLGTGKGQFLPHDEDWHRTGVYAGRHGHIETIRIGSMDGVDGGHFFGFCKGLDHRQTFRMIEFIDRRGLFGGQALNPLGCLWEFHKLLRPRHTTLRRLILGRPGDHVALDSVATDHLSKALGKFGTLEEFVYRANDIDDDAARRLFEALAGHAGLKTLRLSGSHRMEESGYAAFSDLIEGLQSLEAIDPNKKTRLEVWLEEFGNQLPKKRKVECTPTIGLCEGFVDDRLAAVLSTALAMRSFVKELDLSNNLSISGEGWEAIFTLLRRLKVGRFSPPGLQPFVDMDLELMPLALAWMGRRAVADDDICSTLLHQFVRATPELFELSPEDMPHRRFSSDTPT